MVEITAEEQSKEKRMKRIEDNLRDCWDNTKCTNIRIIGVPEEEEEKKGSEKIFEEIIVENYSGNSHPSPGSTESPIQDNPRKNTPRHILIKLTEIKFKEKIFREARETQKLTYKEIPMRLSADFSAEILQARREWRDILKVMKGKNLQPRLLHPARISFRFDREIKSFSDKQKLREFCTTKPALQQMLKKLP